MHYQEHQLFSCMWEIKLVDIIIINFQVCRNCTTCLLESHYLPVVVPVGFRNPVIIRSVKLLYYDETYLIFISPPVILG
jgi:hypothetical protein